MGSHQYLVAVLVDRGYLDLADFRQCRKHARRVGVLTYSLLVLVPLGFPLLVIVPSWLGGFGFQPDVYSARDQVTHQTRYSNLTGTTTVGFTSMVYDGVGRLTNLQHLNSSSANIRMPGCWCIRSRRNRWWRLPMWSARPRN